jgi:hypothetical protein
MSELPGSTRRRERNKPLARSERFLIAYAVLGGAAWTAVFFDGTIGGFINGVIAFLVTGFALTYIASRLDDRAHERARFPGESRDSAEPRAERERPPVSASHLWSRRGAVALFFAGLTGCVIHRVALERKQLDLEFVVAALAMVFAVVAVIRLDRKALIAADAWRAERRAARDPDSKQPDARQGAEASVQPLPDDPRARQLAQLEKLLIVFVVLGLPLCLIAFGGAAGFVTYLGLIVLWLGLLDRLDSRMRPGMRISNNAAEQRRAQERIRRSRGPWSATPPRQLKHMRVAFAVLVVLGGIGCVVMPFLDDESPAERSRQAVTFVIGSVIAFGALALAERKQKACEQRWLEDRLAGREHRAAQ